MAKKQKLRNIIKCLQCGEMLESKFRHDFQKCGCPNQSFVDGGMDYCRIGGIDISKIHCLREDSEIKEYDASNRPK